MKRLNGVHAPTLYTETPEAHLHTPKIGILDVPRMLQDFTFEMRRVVTDDIQTGKHLGVTLNDLVLATHANAPRVAAARR